MSAGVHVIGGGGSSAEPLASVLGGKASNLVRLERLGLRVPPALCIDTSVARTYLANGTLPQGFRAQLERGLADLEAATGFTIGSDRPLLVSVRSSPPVSMPGMLETVLNVGLTEAGVHGLIRRTGNPWFAWDTFRRLVLSFGEVVYRRGANWSCARTEAHLAQMGVPCLEDLDPLSMRDLALRTADQLWMEVGSRVPEDPVAQVTAAIEAVLGSWTAPRAQEYRRLHDLDGGSGTAVLVQAMVFGNTGPRSGSGVGFTRDPATGDDELYVDFAFNCQGEDIVSGRHALATCGSLGATLPDVWTELVEAKGRLERHFRDMQDFEFTVEDGQLYYLQTRTGKRTPWASLRIATSLAAEGLIGPAEALNRLANVDLARLERVTLQPRQADLPIGRAVAASAGVASGAVSFDPDRARQMAETTPVVLVRTELATDDISGLATAAGLLTRLGGRTSHAAVVARQLGTVCLVGCRDLRIDEAARSCMVGSTRIDEGDIVTLDADHGLIYAGAVPVVRQRPDADLAVLRQWRRQKPAAQPA